jgi:membrane protease subunit HflK
VGPREQAIVATAGAWGPVQGPGLAVSWPWPVGTVRIENVAAVRHLAFPEGAAENLMLTRDGALVDLAWDLRWRVVDLRRHALALADPAAALPVAAEAAMRGTVAGMDLAEIAGIAADGGAPVARAPLAQRAAQRLQAMLDRYGAGIVIDGIDLRRAGPPARVADAWRSVAAARNEAVNEAVQAQSWARQTIVRAEGDAAAFDKVDELYRRAPGVTRRQIYYATMERVLGQSDKVIVDAPGTVIQMPQQSQGQSLSPGGPLPAAPQPGAKAGNGH